MAPPIPGLRPPVARPRGRTAGDVFAAIGAIIVLAALTAGVPFALTLFVGLPIPHMRPSVSLLTGEISLQTILRFLSIVIWLAWAQLVWCVIVEIQAAVRNVGVPARVPLSGGTQSLAHRLVTAALLLFSAAAALSPALSTGNVAAPRPVYSVSAQAQFPGQAHTTAATVASPDDTATPQAAHAQHAQVQKFYTVTPPEGRYHESLWEIANNHLGDGRRYNEIFELNKDAVQPDGSKLTIASLIRPGWVLKMPGDAVGHGIQTATQQEQQPGPARQVADSASSTGTTGRSVNEGKSAADHNERSVVSAWPAELAAASLLAAGVLAALGRRRRERLWQRAFGRRLIAPGGDAAVAEAALRLGADDPATTLLDTALRHMSAALAARGSAPPTVFAAHLGEQKLDLWIAPADPQPPAPWLAVDGGQVWRLPGAAAPVFSGTALDGNGALAPYPGLVSLGTNETGRILVDLEAASGLIAFHGPKEQGAKPELVRAALAALAVELVTNRWSDRMRVTLVGFGNGLELIAPDRVTVVRTLEEALPELEQRAADLEGQLAAWGLDSVLTGRTMTGNVETWAPHYLIMGQQPTPEQAQRLLTVAAAKQRTAVGLVVAGEVPGASWDFELTADGRLHAGVLGFDLEPQLLPPAQYAALVSLFRDGDGDAPLRPPSAGDVTAAYPRPGTAPTASLGLLGPASVTAPGAVEPSREALVTELVMYLAAYPGGVHPNVLAGALWPRGVTSGVRDATVSRARQWLGADAHGQPNLLVDPDGRLRLGPEVRVDWAAFRGLVAAARESSDAGASAACLRDALSLVRGQLLDGRTADRYAWLSTCDFCYEVTALVADTAHSLSALLLSQGDPGGAMDAARSGLRLAFDDELLWRDLLRGAAGCGDELQLRAVVDEVSTRVALDEVMARMAPETEALIDELLPSWRSSAA
jgi:hypothetical protein